MENKRIRIADIAEELGVSTATVSNVIHGKTNRVSDNTVKAVQRLLEERHYIPSMAGILLAQNNSKIIGIVINDHKKYNGHTLEDQFISSAVNCLAIEIENAEKFLMLKITDKWSEIPKFASMWNMEGMVLIGFCKQDYQNLREQIHIPFVVYDGYMNGSGNLVNIEVDHFDGGVQAGKYLKNNGHTKVLCISDNNICMDMERYNGLRIEIPSADLMIIPMEQNKRQSFYKEHLEKIKTYTAVFAVSDYYAMDFVNFIKSVGLSVPKDISVIGFDDVRGSEKFDPPLTTIRQDSRTRAKMAMAVLNDLQSGKIADNDIKLPVILIERQSVKRYEQ